MYKRVLYWGFVAAGVALVSVLGCKSSEKAQAPGHGGLPSGVDVTATPKLNASTYFAHGHLLERQGQYDQAVEQYRRALEQAPNFVSGRNRLGITLNKLGRHTEATAEFRLAIRQAPGEASLFNNLGFSLYLQGKYAEAEQALQHALRIQPEFNRAHMNLGVVLAKLGRFDEALAEFTVATSESEGYYNIAVVYTEIGHFASAARMLEKALALRPDFDEARRQLHVVAHLAAEAEAARAFAAGEPGDDATAQLTALTPTLIGPTDEVSSIAAPDCCVLYERLTDWFIGPPGWLKPGVSWLERFWYASLWWGSLDAGFEEIMYAVLLRFEAQFANLFEQTRFSSVRPERPINAKEWKLGISQLPID